jgi:cohesin loading factor subunit SCC2
MALDKSMTTAKKISGDQDGDASLFGGILTNHADRLLDMTQSVNPPVRFASLELIAVLLKQGQVNPNDAVPYLFALQGDCEEPRIRHLALQLLMVEGEKRPDMLRQRIRAGIKKACDFQRASYPNKEVSALVTVRHGDTVATECVFNDVFKECLVRNRKQRHGFYRSLIGLFLLPDAAGISSTDAVASPDKRLAKRHKSSRATRRKAAAPAVDLDLILFASQILAYLPYEASGDILYIAHEIVKARSLHEDEIVEALAALLRPVGLSSSDALDESLIDEDALERAAAAKFPSRTNEAKALSRPGFDVALFAARCHEASALTLLLRLKTYLCVTYNVSDARVHEYNPEGKESIPDKGISKPAAGSALFDSSIGVGGRGRGLGPRSPNLDHLIRVYAAFRRAMRLEHSQFESDLGRAVPEFEGDGDDGGSGTQSGGTNGSLTGAEATDAQESASHGRKPLPAESNNGVDDKPPTRKRRGSS